MNTVFKQELIQRSITAFVLIFGGLYIFFALPPWCFSLVIFLIALYTAAVEMPHLLPYKGLKFWLLVSVYPLLPFFLIILLNQNIHYRMLVFLAFVVASSNDIGAYFTGKLLGKNKMLPSISPKKTWEGFAGGFLLTALALWYIAHFHNKPTSLAWFFVFALAFAIIGTAGDFFESWLKRRANIKDSGSLLPGHGGTLDRFDSVLFIILFIYFCKGPLLHLFF